MWGTFLLRSSLSNSADGAAADFMPEPMMPFGFFLSCSVGFLVELFDTGIFYTRSMFYKGHLYKGHCQNFKKSKGQAIVIPNFLRDKKLRICDIHLS